MTETNNLHLPQFEATDRIHHDDFNDAMAKIDTAMPRIVFGTYTGDGQYPRDIELPFVPKILFIIRDNGTTYSSGTNGGLLTQEHPIPDTASLNGATLTLKRDYINSSSRTYYYVAVL